jgi:ParB-like chromosome segregation protein Spo0J
MRGVTRVTPAMASERLVAISELGDELSGLRMCEPAALEAMRRSLARHGQLTALVTYQSELGPGLEIIDGFKRLRAAQALEWRELYVTVAPDTSGVDAKVRIAELHDGRGLTEIEEAWLVHALCRQDGLAQGAVAQRLGRHKSWVCRRLLLVEALDPAVQADVRLGLLAARAAVALAQLPRGNQPAAAEVVVRRGLTVRQTEQLVVEVLGSSSAEQRERVLESWRDGSRIPTERATSRRRLRSEAEWMLADIATVCRAGARLQARLLGTPLYALGEGPCEMVRRALLSLEPVLDALACTVVNATAASKPAPGADP